MLGPDVIARSISAATIPDQHGNHWQYHSRSDRHSKVACWVAAFDLMQASPLLREHLDANKVVLGVNHKLEDFQTGREKKLDLVIAQPAASVPTNLRSTFTELADDYGVVLDDDQRSELVALPLAPVAEVGSVLVALEAKAAMTAHVKALPRLHDELDSSHMTTHGNSERALAVGFVMVNAGESFISPDRNKRDLATHPPEISSHTQPRDAQRVIDKVAQIRRRSGGSATGFDALGVMVVDLKNDGSDMVVLEKPDPRFPYPQMIQRVAHEYAAAFAKL